MEDIDEIKEPTRYEDIAAWSLIRLSGYWLALKKAILHPFEDDVIAEQDEAREELYKLNQEENERQRTQG